MKGRYTRLSSNLDENYLDEGIAAFIACKKYDADSFWILMITSSASFSGAKPTTIFTLPLSISPCVAVSQSHFTKNASSLLLPSKAPFSAN
ncbi:MAG: hypothetical protein WBE34_10995 [Candidatus Nitrosopolaris sp.]